MWSSSSFRFPSAGISGLSHHTELQSQLQAGIVATVCILEGDSASGRLGWEEVPGIKGSPETQAGQAGRRVELSQRQRRL